MREREKSKKKTGIITGIGIGTLLAMAIIICYDYINHSIHESNNYLSQTEYSYAEDSHSRPSSEGQHVVTDSAIKNPLDNPSESSYSVEYTRCDPSLLNCGVPTKLEPGEAYIVDNASCDGDGHIIPSDNEQDYVAYVYVSSDTARCFEQ
jgi:hypothetical protein